MALSKERRRAYAALLDTLPKRPKAVLQKILENGSVSTYELGQLGYDQPPRAAQDLKEHGVRLKSTTGTHPKSGARMAIYSLLEDDELAAAGGRRAFPSKFRADVLAAHESRCNLCNQQYPAKSLQLDHRIPYIVGGESAELKVPDFQLLCGSHQRKKSWECEHCPNRVAKDPNVCRTCYYAFPDTDTEHVATLPVRYLEVVFTEDEIDFFERIQKASAALGLSTTSFVKEAVAERLDPKQPRRK